MKEKTIFIKRYLKIITNFQQFPYWKLIFSTRKIKLTIWVFCFCRLKLNKNSSPFSLLRHKSKLESLKTKMLSLTSKRIVQGLASRVAQSPALQVLPRQYHERVVDHYNNPRNVGSFDKTDPTVGTGLVGAPACGDVMKLQIKVDEKTGKIVDACFKTFGCGSAIASSSVG